MANKHWIGLSGANWNISTNWTPNGIPLSTDSIFIDAGGAAVATQTQNASGSLSIASTASLTIGGSATGTLTISGNISNAGTISLAGSSSVNANLRFGSALTLTGGGHVTLTDSANNTLSIGTLTNQDNTIAGAGTFIGMTLVNQGLIEATYSDVALTLNTGHQITNNGILEANGGKLVIGSHDLVAGTGSMLITGGGTLVLNLAQEQQAINFSGPGSLVLGGAYLGSISGFGASDIIDLSYVFSTNFGTGSTKIHANWVENSANTGGTLTIIDPNLPSPVSTVATLTLKGQYTSSQFVVSDDGSGIHPKVSLGGSSGPPPAPPTSFLLFDGPSADLWLSDGTALGTYDLGIIANASSGGLNPHYLTAFSGKVLFEGTNASEIKGLWSTDGSAAGTHELTGIAGANPAGLFPSHMMVYGNKVLFQGEAGVAGNFVPGLWVSDGTAAGTFEIGGVANIGIAGISHAGLVPTDPDFTLFNGKVLFSGRDAANNQGLWVTDGTAVGTLELAPISGAFAVGSPGSDVLGSGADLTVLGNKVLFRGTDLEDTGGSLWVTDGTAAGTFEIGGQGNATIVGSPNGFNNQFTSELPHGIQPRDLTTLNGKVLFAGQDNTLKPNGFYADTDGLWVSDGTAGGTFELGGIGNAGISGANPASNGGIFWFQNIEFPAFTVYHGKALFMGFDATHHVSLWQTDGTAAGTIEIGGLGNAGISNVNSGGLLINTLDPNFTIFNDHVYFSGDNANGSLGLWVTDGTAGGTHEVAAMGSLYPDDIVALAPATTPPPVTVTVGNGHHDQVTVAGASTSFAITPDGAGGVLVTGSGSLPTYQLDQVEFIHFSDHTVFVENADNANIARLYSAALNRAPDTGGLAGWEDLYANNISGAAKAGGVYLSLAQTPIAGAPTSIAQGFTLSTEFQQHYGTLDDAGFVTLLYQNVLDRNPSTGERDAWVANIHNGESREMVLVGFAESQENIAKTAADWLIQI